MAQPFARQEHQNHSRLQTTCCYNQDGNGCCVPLSPSRSLEPQPTPAIPILPQMYCRFLMTCNFLITCRVSSTILLKKAWCFGTCLRSCQAKTRLDVDDTKISSAFAIPPDLKKNALSMRLLSWDRAGAQAQCLMMASWQAGSSAARLPVTGTGRVCSYCEPE